MARAGRKLVLVLTWGLAATLVAVSGMASPERRVALVIGNGAYGDAALRNPVNDARDVAVALGELGFEVDRLLDADQRAMEEAIAGFTRELDEEHVVGLFYFAGHGIELDGQNYLVPVDASISSESDVKYKAVNAGYVLDGMTRAGNGLNLMVLDACRNNPYARSFRSGSRGLVEMKPATGTLILYATEPGQLARDGEGRNGVFTEKLLEQLKRPGLSAEEVFKGTALGVHELTAGEQTPWQEGVILGHFVFRPASEQERMAKAAETGLAIEDSTSKSGAGSEEPALELELWRSTEACGTSSCYQAYLRTFPDGTFVELARAKLEAIPARADRAAAPEERTCCRLTVEVTPADARVRVMDIAPAYSPGMWIDPGRHRILVERDGYSSVDRWIEVTSPKHTETVSLVERTAAQAASEDEAIDKGLVSARGAVPSEEDEFRTAHAKLEKGDPQGAEGELVSYLERHPHGRFADDAEYLLAVASFNRRDYKRAIAGFQRVVARNSKSSNAPDSLLKMATSYFELGQRAAARETLNRLIRDYPRSTEARMAESVIRKAKRDRARN